MTESNFESSLLRGHKDSIISIHRNIDASILSSSSDDNTVRIWDVRCKNSAIRLLKVPETTGEIGVCRMSEESLFVSSGNVLFAYDLRLTGCVIVPTPSWSYACQDDDEEINDFTVNGDVIALPTDAGNVRFVSKTQNNHLHSTQAHTNIAAACRFLPSGSNIASGGYDCNVATLKIDTSSARVERAFPVASLIPLDEEESNNPSQSVNPPFVTSMDVSADQLVVGSGDGSVVVMDLKKGGSRIDNRRISWGGASVHPVSVSSVAFAGNGSVWSAGNDSVLINMGETQINVRYPIGFKPNAIASMGDGRVAVAGVSNEIHLLHFR